MPVQYYLEHNSLKRMAKEPFVRLNRPLNGTPVNPIPPPLSRDVPPFIRRDSNGDATTVTPAFAAKKRKVATILFILGELN